MNLYDPNEKTRNFTFLVYPDSAPSGWKDFLRESRLRIAISPLHDKDFDPETLELKKPHYHVLMMYPNTIAIKTIKKRFCDPLNTLPPQVVKDMKGMYAYLTHRYDLDKTPYDPNEIECLNGFDPMDIGQMTFMEKVNLQKDTFRFIQNNDISSFSELIDKLMEVNDVYILDYCRKNFGMIGRYLDSKSRQFDMETALLMRDAISELESRVKAVEKHAAAVSSDPTVSSLSWNSIKREIDGSFDGFAVDRRLQYESEEAEIEDSDVQ